MYCKAYNQFKYSQSAAPVPSKCRSGLEYLDDVFDWFSADWTKTALILHNIHCTLKAHTHVTARV